MHEFDGDFQVRVSNVGDVDLRDVAVYVSESDSVRLATLPTGTTSTYRPEATCLGSANCTRNVPPFVGSSSAIRPFHRTYSTGSVNSRNTVSGDASIVTEDDCQGRREQ